MVTFFRIVPASRKALVFLGVLGALFLGLAVLFASFGWSARRTQLTVSAAGLRIDGPYGRALPAADLNLTGARRVDFAREPGLQPVTRTNGIGLPGYLAGWVRLRDGGKALVFLTDPSRVVAVPTTRGYVVLASLEEPDRFLQVLREPRGDEVFPVVPASGATLWFTAGFALLMLATAGLMAYLAALCRNVRYEVGPAGLRIVGMYGRMIPIASLLLEEARQVDLGEERSLQPVLRTNGAAVPGFLAGWVRLGSGAKALVFLTDFRRVVYVPTRDRYALLLSVEEPDRLLTALREAA
ncbi:MAG: hypothetical protein K0Q72_4679 [Armatimonadetes bacterium]|jgi:hypothetical protein|nr:hypothetical protein [Armatimonadota bacterium]